MNVRERSDDLTELVEVKFRSIKTTQTHIKAPHSCIHDSAPVNNKLDGRDI